MKLDSRKLTETIELCFERSMDTGLPPVERGKFLAEGKKLRRQLIDLLSAQFDAEFDDEISEANSRLGEVAKQLRKKIDELSKVKQQIAELRGIAKLLDTLLTGAVSLV